MSGPTIKSAKQPTSSNAFQIKNQYNTIMNSNLIWNVLLWNLKIKDKASVPIQGVHRSKLSIVKLMNQISSNSNVESTLAVWRSHDLNYGIALLLRDLPDAKDSPFKDSNSSRQQGNVQHQHHDGLEEVLNSVLHFCWLCLAILYSTLCGSGAGIRLLRCRNLRNSVYTVLSLDKVQISWCC